MRILQILHDRERGGVDTLAHTIEHGLTPHGMVFETAYLFGRPGLGLVRKLSGAAAMARRILRGGFDALIAYQATASILVGAVGWLADCRVRIVHQTCTPGETALPVRLIDRAVGALGLYTVNIANSAFTRAEFRKYPERYRRAMILIEHGLDPPAPTRPRADTRRRFGLPVARPLLLNVGRLVAQKNQEVLIRALPRLGDVHLAVVGSGANADPYRGLAADLGVADRLHLVGPIASADIADLYAAADLFVFPSTWETFGLAAVEAAMVGMPMVVADLSVLHEVLATEGRQPVVFAAPHDVDGWVAAILSALASPPAGDVKAEYAARISRKYSRARMIESYLRLLASNGTGRAWNGLAQEISA